jgi:methanogenic corrinoid protein MtbC1
VRRGNRDDALALVLEPVASGSLGLAEFYDLVIGPVAARVGDLWHAGAISVADEHRATAVNREARRRARRLFEPEPPNGRRVVLACAPEEQHALGLAMAGDVLELAGYETEVLGARTPARDLASFAEQVAADAVAVSCSSPITITGLIEAVTLVHALGVPVVVGGRAVRDYPAIARAARADAVCTDTTGVVEVVEGLLRT